MAKAHYLIADTFMIRTPLLPLSVLDELSAACDIDKVLKKYYCRQKVKEALFLASPGMYNMLEEWLDKGSSCLKDHEKFRSTLIKYLIRMSSRSTPFGMFAGIGGGSFGKKNEIHLSGKSIVFARPDMQYLCSLSERLLKDRKLREKTLYFPNTSLYPIGDAYRYIEFFTSDEGIRKYQLQSTMRSEELTMIIDNAKKGKAIEELASLLCEAGVEIENAREYIHALIDNQVLISELEPGTTGQHFFDDLVQKAKQILPENTLSKELHKIHSLFDDINSPEQDKKLEQLVEVVDVIRHKHANLKENSLIQADMKHVYESAGLAESCRQNLEQVLPKLMKLTDHQPPLLLNNFKEAFSRRYGEREVPLLIAMDAENGPGYLPGDDSAHDSELLRDIRVPEATNNYRSEPGRMDDLLKQKLQESMMSGSSILEISETDLEKISLPDKAFPTSFYGMTRMLGKWTEDQEKQLIQLITLGGSSALSLAARFSYMDEQLRRALEELAAKEQQSSGDAIIAEIVHLPQQRTGNILLRPVLRGYEIPYLANASVEQDRIIMPSELLVSIKDDKIVLRSERLNKYIIPRMANAHNFTMGSLPVYRFLCELQLQEVYYSIGFSWGSLSSGFSYLPRVMYQNFILQAAMWSLGKNDIMGVQKAGTDKELLSSCEKLRETYHIPSEVLLTAGDNELWIDLGNLQSLRLFQNEIRHASHVIIKEFLFDKKEGIVQGKDGLYANEFVFFYHQKGGLEHGG